MRLVLIRHYKTRFNITGQVMGWGDSSPGDDWREDLDYIAGVIGQRELVFDRIYSSDLERSQQTAAYFSRLLGVRQVSAAIELNEINYGDLFGKSKKWVREHYPQYKTDAAFVFPNGESFQQMQKRSVDFVSSMAQACAGENVLAVVHAGLVRGLVSHFLGLDYAPQLKRQVSHRYLAVLDFDGANCVRYEEWGEPSGFVRDLGLEQPCNIMKV